MRKLLYLIPFILFLAVGPPAFAADLINADEMSSFAQAYEAASDATIAPNSDGFVSPETVAAFGFETIFLSTLSADSHERINPKAMSPGRVTALPRGPPG